MGKTVYIDVELEKKKVIKQMKDLEKDLDKFTKKDKVHIKLNPKVSNKKVKKDLKNLEVDFKKEIKKLNNSFSLKPTINDTKVNQELSNVRQDLEGFYKRIESNEAKSYAKRLAEMERYKKKLSELKKLAEKTGNTDVALELSEQLERFKLKTSQARAELRNFSKVGKNDVSVLGKLFNDVTDEIGKSREQLIKLGKSTKGIDKLEREIEEVNQDFKSGKINAIQYAKSLQKINSSSKKATKETNLLGGAMTKLVSAVAGLAIMDKSKDFVVGMEKTVAKLKITTGSTDKELKNFTKSARNLQKQGFGDFDKNLVVLSGIKRSLKITGEEAEKVASNVLLISENFGESETEILKATNSLSKNMKISFQESGDFILKALQKTNDPDLVDNIAEYSVNFEKMGYSAKDMFNIMIKGSDSGAYKLDKVNDAIKEAEVSITDNSKTTRKAFQDLGLDYDDYLNKLTSGEVKVKDILQDVNSKLLQLDVGLQDEVGTAIYKTKWEELSDEVLVGLTDIEDKIGNVDGTTKDAIESISGFEKGFGILKGTIGEFVDNIRNWGKENPKLASSIGIVTAVLGGLAIAIGAVGLATTLLLPGLAAIGGLLSPIIVPILGITAALGALGIAYKENLGGFADKVNELGAKVGEVFGYISETILQFIDYLNQKFGDELTAIFEGAGEIFKGFVNVINIGLDWVLGLFSKSTEELGFWEKIVKSVFDIVGVAFQNLMSVLEFGLSTIGNLFRAFGQVMQGDFRGAFDSILNIGRNFGETLKNIFKTSIGGTLDILGNFSVEARKWGENLIQAMVDGINSKVEEVKNAVAGVGDQIKGFLGVASPTKYGPLAVDQSKWGSNLVGAFVKGMKKKTGDVVKQTKKIANKLLKLSGINLKSPKLTKAKKYKTRGKEVGINEAIKKELEETKNLGNIFGEKFMKSLSQGMSSESKLIQKEAEKISNELEKINKLAGKYRNKKSVSDRLSKLNGKLDTAAYNSDNFKKIKAEIVLLTQLQNKYNGQQTDQEKKLYKLRIDGIDELAKSEDKNSKDLLKQYKQRIKAIESLKKIELDGMEDKEKKEEEVAEKILSYKTKASEIVKKIIDEERKSIEKLFESIQKLQKEAEKITEDKDTSIAERKLEIEKERKEILEDISKLDNSGRLGRTGDRVKDIDEDLEGNLTESQRNRLLDKRETLLVKINEQIKNSNNLNGEAYNLKKKLLEIDKEQELIEKNINSESLEKVEGEKGKSSTQKILDKYEEEKKEIEEKLKVQIEAYKDDEVAYNDVLKNKAIGEESFTSLIKGETTKRIGEQARLLENAKQVVAEMAALGFNGKGFTASFRKTDSETGKTTTVNRTVNITNNNKIEKNIDIAKLGRKLGKQIARREASGNIL